jgi:hypothetical protein
MSPAELFGRGFDSRHLHLTEGAQFQRAPYHVIGVLGYNALRSPNSGRSEEAKDGEGHSRRDWWQWRVQH